MIGERTEVSRVQIEYYQESDSCSSNTDGQELIVFTEDAGGGPFIVIKTERWAIDAEDIDLFCNELKMIIKKANNEDLA